ncbi:MAG: hypothetical protein ACRCWL_03135, partial [Aeromonas sp.]
FAINPTQASMLLSQIHREPRFASRIQREPMADTKRLIRRLFVDGVRDPAWQKTPVIGRNDHGQTVQFASLHEAQDKGGFIRDRIAHCLRKPGTTHAGYHWRVVRAGDDATQRTQGGQHGRT